MANREMEYLPTRWRLLPTGSVMTPGHGKKDINIATRYDTLAVNREIEHLPTAPIFCLHKHVDKVHWYVNFHPNRPRP